MIRKPKSFKWAEMDYNAIQLERKISEYFTRDEKLSNSETSCFSERLNRSGIHAVIAVDNDTTDFVTVYLYDYNKRKFITKGKTVFTSGNLIDNIWSAIENLEKSINEDSLTENIKNNRRRVNEVKGEKMKFSDYLNEDPQKNNLAKKYADIVLKDAKEIMDVLNKVKDDDETSDLFCRNMVYHLSRTSSLLRDYVMKYENNTDNEFTNAVNKDIGRISKELSALNDID